MKPINLRRRFEVFRRDDFRCQYCGRRAPEVAIEVEHMRPISLGGTDDMWNLASACQQCNAGKSNIPLTIDQIRCIDGHVPNLIAQLVAVANRPGVLERLFEISCGGKLFGQWAVDLEALLDDVDVESLQEIDA